MSVGNGATFGGRGSAGNTAVADGAAGGIVEAGQGGTGSLTLAALAFAGKGTVNVSNVGAGASASVVNAGVLAANGPVGSVTINVSGPNLLTGAYKLIGYGGDSIAGAGGFGAFTLGATPALNGPRKQPCQLINNAGEIDLLVSNDYIIWTGAASSEWSTGTIAAPKNWRLVSSSAPADYLEAIDQGNDYVAFDDSSGSSVRTVTISGGNIRPANVDFNNSTAANYILQSPGGFSIAGTTGLTKSGNRQDPRWCKNPERLLQQPFGPLGVEDVEEHGVIHAGRRQPGAVCDEIAEANAHIVQLLSFRSCLNSTDHFRLKVEGVNDSRGDPRGRNRKGSVAAAEVHDVAARRTQAEFPQNCYWLEEPGPHRFFRHAAVAYLHDVTPGEGRPIALRGRPSTEYLLQESPTEYDEQKT